MKVMKYNKTNFLSLILIFIALLFINIHGFSAPAKKKNNYRKKEPVKLVIKLFYDLKYHRFSSAMNYTTGMMSDWINRINKFLLEAPKKKIKAFKNNLSRLHEIRFYNLLIKGRYAFVWSLWVHKSPQNEMHKFKVRDQVYLLEKKKHKWLLKSYRFQGEYIIHDIEKVRRIQKKARQMDRERYRQYLKKRRNRRYRRRGRYR
jgi:hypothetical protein